MKKIKSQFYGIDFVKDEKIQNISTYHNKGHVKCVFYPKNSKQLIFLYNLFSINKIPFKVIGNGSNILISPKGKNYFYISTKNMRHYIRFNKNYCTINCSCPISFVYQKCLANSLSGFENIAGIPGTIGGAIKMNAGAYGGEMKDIVVSTKCIELKKENKGTRISNIGDIEITEPPENIDESNIVTLENNEQNFSYRNSVFSDKKYIILETKLQLPYGTKSEIQEKMDEYSKARKEKQPDLPSAGSTFKRGEDYITAKLIDECGLKGYKIGGAQVSEKHAGFIVNTGNATAKDIIDLINYVKKVVHEKTGKDIELEIEVLGE